MTEAAQQVFFQKIRAAFSRVTVGIPVEQKKKYRLSPDEVTKMRNLSCFFSQVWPFLASRMPEIEAQAKEKGFRTSMMEDDDFLPFLETRPARLSLSMLKSQQDAARKQEAEKQDMIHSEVSAQKQAVTNAQWSFFQSALKQDQAMLQRVQAVPAKLKAKLHGKTVEQRRVQSEAGEKAIKGYQELTFTAFMPRPRIPTCGWCLFRRWSS